jgi:hypothetical protein
MADIADEKRAPTENVQTPDHSLEVVDIPTGWKYKTRKLGPLTLPWYASPESQLLLVAFVSPMPLSHK